MLIWIFYSVSMQLLFSLKYIIMFDKSGNLKLEDVQINTLKPLEDTKETICHQEAADGDCSGERSMLYCLS